MGRLSKKAHQRISFYEFIEKLVCVKKKGGGDKRHCPRCGSDIQRSPVIQLCLTGVLIAGSISV